MVTLTKTHFQVYMLYNVLYNNFTINIPLQRTINKMFSVDFIYCTVQKDIVLLRLNDGLKYNDVFVECL